MTWLGLLALVLAICGGGTAAARADVCVVVDPVIALCRDTPSPPGGDEPPPKQPAASQPASAPQEREPVQQTSSEVRYDPRGLAVTFAPETLEATARRIIAEAGTTLEQAIPEIGAYLVDVDRCWRARP
jgi:hypothetical protein